MPQREVSVKVVTLPVINADRATCVQCGWSTAEPGFRIAAMEHAANFLHRVTLTHIYVEQIETIPDLKVVS